MPKVLLMRLEDASTKLAGSPGYFYQTLENSIGASACVGWLGRKLLATLL